MATIQLLFRYFYEAVTCFNTFVTGN